MSSFPLGEGPESQLPQTPSPVLASIPAHTSPEEFSQGGLCFAFSAHLPPCALFLRAQTEEQKPQRHLTRACSGYTGLGSKYSPSPSKTVFERFQDEQLKTSEKSKALYSESSHSKLHTCLTTHAPCTHKRTRALVCLGPSQFCTPQDYFHYFCFSM